MLLFSVVVLCCCAVAVGHPSNFVAIVFHGGRQRSGLVPSHLVPGRPLRLRACRFQLLLYAPVIFSKFCTCLFSNQSFFEFDHYMSLLRRSKQGLPFLRNTFNDENAIVVDVRQYFGKFTGRASHGINGNSDSLQSHSLS